MSISQRISASVPYLMQDCLLLVHCYEVSPTPLFEDLCVRPFCCLNFLRNMLEQLECSPWLLSMCWAGDCHK